MLPQIKMFSKKKGHHLVSLPFMLIAAKLILSKWPAQANIAIFLLNAFSDA